MTETTTAFQDMTGQNAAASPTIHPATAQARPRSPWRLTAIALTLALILGAVAGGWVVLYLFSDKAEPTAAIAPAPPTSDTTKVESLATTAAPAPSVAVLDPVETAVRVDPTSVAARIGLLEERLTRLTLAANSASGNAAKAEAILVAFAARRALDRGLPLGPMEAQLRLRFSETQPIAVSSILDAASHPVTEEELLEQLRALRPTLMADSSASWLSRLGNGVSSLIVIRSADVPSTAPNLRFERAERAMAAGRADEAINEIIAMPGHADPLTQQWLIRARRYNDARRALDLIETAAILEPGENRGTAIPAPAK